MQTMPGPHCALVVQLDPLPDCTVTLKVTAAPPAFDCTVTRNDGSAACVVSRNACASPPAPVGTVRLLDVRPLHWEFAAGGSRERVPWPRRDRAAPASRPLPVCPAP